MPLPVRRPAAVLLAALALAPWCAWPQEPDAAEAPPAAAAEAAEPEPPPGPPPPGPPAETFAGALQVQLVELYVAVTDPGGEPVRGLTAADFAVAENGMPQRIDSVVDAADLPLTLGLAVDTSASMFVKLPVVAEAAQGLLDSLQSGRDRAFLVAFGPEPRLVERTTGGLWRVGSALSRLEPDGGTPLWRSIVLSLGELGAVKGKRALVILADGADDDGADAFRRAFELARQSQVPIYLVVMNNEAARTAGKEFRTRSFTAQLERLAAATGGAVYYLRTDADLGAVYGEIERALRSYYLVTYYPEPVLSPGQWRNVEVRVAGEGLRARTIPGYDPGARRPGRDSP